MLRQITQITKVWPLPKGWLWSSTEGGSPGREVSNEKLWYSLVIKKSPDDINGIFLEVFQNVTCHGILLGFYGDSIHIWDFSWCFMVTSWEFMGSFMGFTGIYPAW